ncbi:hypothetical protein UUU_45360 [Klebsiella pneumoniae subsp. pneumoniae DSM 30104 = JCM 1662 = NBRC 14940]|nr:hypothetical protein UUU_45360 [Klebsiella pneumoniae subsp. pneumoniae DSM 30104 = JCM 1662 = NBRC 14940]
MKSKPKKPPNKTLKEPYVIIHIPNLIIIIENSLSFFPFSLSES